MPNIFLKSILRQPVKLTVLVILLVAATFAVTLRVAEYVIIRHEITRIEGYYRSIGYLWPMSRGIRPIEVNRALTNIRNMEQEPGIGISVQAAISPYLNFEDPAWQYAIENDHRVALTDRRDMYSGQLLDMFGPYSWQAFFSGRNLGDYSSDAIFTATLQEGYSYWVPPSNHSQTNPFSIAGPSTFLVKYFVVEEVFAGQEDHIRTGEELALIIPLWANGFVASEGMQAGNTYLLRAWHYHAAYNHFRNAGVTRPARLWPPALVISTLDTSIEKYFVNTNYQNFYKIKQELDPIIQNVNYNNRRVRLISTVDGNLSHVNQGQHYYRLREGRWTNYQDYLDANPVAVIHLSFARTRSLRLGDTLRIVPPMSPNEEPIELTIVGMFDRDNLTPTRRMGLEFRNLSTIYVPASLDLSALAHQYLQFSTPTDSLYSFVLSSPRYQEDFTHDLGPLLLSMGYVLVFIPTNFEFFASVADPIIQNLIINLVVFCASGLAVLLLVGFIYMRMANKNLALCRALGMPRHTTLRRAVAPIILFALPAMGIGAVAAWWYATTSADGTLAPLYELEPHLAATSSLGLSSVLWLAAGIVAVTVGIVLVMVVQRLRKPVLRLLQG